MALHLTAKPKSVVDKDLRWEKTQSQREVDKHGLARVGLRLTRLAKATRSTYTGLCGRGRKVPPVWPGSSSQRSMSRAPSSPSRSLRGAVSIPKAGARVARARRARLRRPLGSGAPARQRWRHQRPCGSSQNLQTRRPVVLADILAMRSRRHRRSFQVRRFTGVTAPEAPVSSFVNSAFHNPSRPPAPRRCAPSSVRRRPR